MYISAIAVTFSSKDNSSLYTTCLSLDHVSGGTLLHALDFMYKSPLVKAHLKNRYRIVNLVFKYSEISSL